MTTMTMRSTRVGTVGAYVTSGDVNSVLAVRARAGRVTVSGRPGARVLTELARADDLAGVDFDPAGYRETDVREGLFEVDWVARQHDLGLPVVRSTGVFAARTDHNALRAAFKSKLPDGVVRVVSLSSFWLQRKNNSALLAAVRNCDNPVAFVLADQFDPLRSADAVETLQRLLEASSPGERRVELLRTDTHAIAFAAAGGTHAAIGLTTTGRHHPQPMKGRERDQYDERQQSPAVWIPSLMSWQRGVRLTALEPFDGAGITSCNCGPCKGRDLMRFNCEYPRVPDGVRADAQAHDVVSWASLRDRILTAANPNAAWKAACAAASTTEAELAAVYKVVLTTPKSLTAWI